MKYNLLDDLICSAVRKEVSSQIKSKKIDLAQLAKEHSVRMLCEIADIINENISCEQQIQKILKVLVFCPVPPHVNEDIL